VTIDKDDYEAWLANPVTEAFLAVVASLGKDAKARWDAASWDGGKANEPLLVECRTVAGTANYIAGMDYEQFNERHEAKE
jgi:hypothetical protein